MTRKLQFFLIALLLMVGVTSAWATVTLDLEVSFRTNAATEQKEVNTEWMDGYPKKSSASGNTSCTINSNAGEFTLQKYTVTNLSDVTALTLKLVNTSPGNAHALAIWVVSNTDLATSWTEGTSVSNIVSAYTKTVGIAPRATSGTVKTTYLKDIANDNTGGINKFIIEGDALTQLKDAANGNTFTLLITNKTEDIKESDKGRRFYSSNTANDAANRPLLMDSYPVTVTTGSTTTGYATLTAAKAALPSDADATVTIYDDQNFSSRFEAISGKTLNIVAGNNNVTITNTASNTLSFLANTDHAGTINVGSAAHPLIIKNSNTTTNNAVVEVAGSSSDAKVNLTYVTFKDITSSNASGLIKTWNSSANVKLTNVTFDGCTASADNAGIIFANQANMLTLSGNLTFSNWTQATNGYQIRAKGSIVDDGFAPTSAITINWGGSTDEGTTVVTGASASSISNYALSNSDYNLFYDSDNTQLRLFKDHVAFAGGTTYNTLEDAVTWADENATIKILQDCTVSSTITFTKNVTIVPNTTGITVKRSTDLGSNNMFSLATAEKTVTIGDAGTAMTIDGQNTSSGNKIVEVQNGNMNLVNLTIKNAQTSGNQGIVCVKVTNGIRMTLKNITFDNCESTGTPSCVVFNGIAGALVLSGNIIFNDCDSDCDIYTERRFDIDTENGISNTTPIRICVKESNISLGSDVIANTALSTDVDKFFITNENYALYSYSGTESVRGTVKTCEGKTLDVTAAGAATLVLPFAATIPEGVTCYTLNYTTGKNYVKATEVETTLTANTPVLVNAAEGSYKFKNSTNATTATSYTASETKTFGALTGVFQETTPGEGHYILTKHGDNVGFRRTVATSKVKAYRAYLTADGAGAPEFLEINFDGNLTGVDEKVTVKKNTDGQYYNLNGQRVQNPTKGLYIVNGKKVIIK